MPVESVHRDAKGDEHDAVKAGFATRLQAALFRKGWSPSEAARRVASFLEDGEKFSRAHMWHYLQGRALPRSRYLLALSRALDVDPEELLPERLVPADGTHPDDGPGELTDMVHVRDCADGTALLQVRQRVSWEAAMEIVRILKRQDG